MTDTTFRPAPAALPGGPGLAALAALLLGSLALGAAYGPRQGALCSWAGRWA